MCPHVCSQILVHGWWYMCTHAQACMETGSLPLVFSSVPLSLIFWDRTWHWTWTLLIHLNWLASNSRNLLSSVSSVFGLQESMLWLPCVWMQGLQLWSSHLHGKPFPGWAISQLRIQYCECNIKSMFSFSFHFWCCKLGIKPCTCLAHTPQLSYF